MKVNDRLPAAIERMQQAAANAAPSAGYCWKLHPGAAQECTLRRGHDQPPPSDPAETVHLIPLRPDPSRTADG